MQVALAAAWKFETFGATKATSPSRSAADSESLQDKTAHPAIDLTRPALPSFSYYCRQAVGGWGPTEL